MNSEVIPCDDDDDEEHPHDERFSLSTFTIGDKMSLASHDTYKKKESTIPRNAAAAKRSAQKAPSTEPDAKFSTFPKSSASLLPSTGGLNQSNNWQADASQQLLFGLRCDDKFPVSSSLWQDLNLQHQPTISSKPSPSLTDTGSGSGRCQSDHISDRTSNSASTSGRFSDAPEGDILANGVEGITIGSNIPTTVSSLQNPSDMVSRSSTGSRSGNPRSILNERYQKKYFRPFTKKDFVTIRDTRDGDHIPMFTSMFVCPETSECFLSGDLIETDLKLDREGMNWYKKKCKAEFAAAGRAEDCFRFRMAEGGLDQFCHEPPFLKRDRDREEEEISAFLGARACDSNIREKVKSLIKKNNEK